ncbi:MAG TPA: IS481 family transposase [Candidatus Udaeobacter sp.]|nr:IS481 family transposase [Candidatus Udaeobacter sp.]
MSSIARYVVDAVVLEHRSPTELAREHGISRRWIHKLVKRFKEGGYAALAPRSRRPHSCSHQTSSDVQAKVLQLRQELAAAGHDAGPDTIAHHLIGQVELLPSIATIWRILRRNGLITPQPHKRPRSSFIRFEASLPNETWQMDATPWQLADSSPVEIINFLDDNSRVLINSSTFVTVKAADVVQAFYAGSNRFGLPASLLSDNAAVFTAKSRRGKVLIELELERQGIEFKHSSPYHPQTCGKVERFHQTLKRFLRKQSAALSLAELQFQLDAFADYYNHRRPHRALGRQTPMSVFNLRLKAKPSLSSAPVDHRVRRDKIDSKGKVTLRYLGRLRHIPVGSAHRNRRVRLLVAGPDVRVITDDGQLIRALTLDPARSYQPLGGRWHAHNVLQQARTMS